MDTFKTLTATAAVFLFTLPAFAEEAETKVETRPHVTPLERTLIIPDIIGLQFGSLSTLPAVGVSGLVSYSLSESNDQDTRSHFEAFGINPSFDVRAGRFTIGGSMRIGHVYQRFETAGYTSIWRTASIAVVPRVGVLFPVVKHVTFWPRLAVGPTVASNEQQGYMSRTSTSAGVIVSADALVVLDLGTRFFATAGPNANFIYSAGDQPGDRSAQFRIGVNVGMGVSF